MYSAEDRRMRSASSSAAYFGRVFGDLTLRDTVRPLLVPCYDLPTRAPFFSRADAAQSPAQDFRLRNACALPGELIIDHNTRIEQCLVFQRVRPLAVVSPSSHRMLRITIRLAIK
ncbi:hypothetical protein EJB05_14650, partial [Eragrostis curvula]